MDDASSCSAPDVSAATAVAVAEFHQMHTRVSQVHDALIKWYSRHPPSLTLSLLDDPRCIHLLRHQLCHSRLLLLVQWLSCLIGSLDERT